MLIFNTNQHKLMKNIELVGNYDFNEKIEIEKERESKKFFGSVAANSESQTPARQNFPQIQSQTAANGVLPSEKGIFR